MKVGKLSAETGVPHVVNNAYGMALRRCMNVLQEASTKYGRAGVHAVVQSTDKNLLVPVGGAMVVSSDEAVIDRLSSTYAGRAAITPSLDVLITLLSMGLDGMHALVDARDANFRYLREKLVGVAAAFGLRVMDTPHNPVSLAITVAAPAGDTRSVTAIGAQLFHRNISGAR